ncbi:MAG: polymerase sigma-70 factor, subfamily [Acidobacteriota bacterium]|jgi:RNA polymerase sigma-70 factor (ECF subfamily)|nr:polymerase sigma-70 factor, subfamily [Acidobacteriota bacterium]
MATNASVGLRQAELIVAAAEGDQQALASLYDTTSRTVYSLLLRILADPSAAEEVLLDVYTQVWRQAGGYSRERGTPMAWITTIARSRAIDRLRRTRQEQRHTEPLDEAARCAGGVSVEDEASAGEVRAVVRAALDALAPEQREVIELAYYGGMSHSEIAAARGLPLGTVKTRTRLGMMRLRDILKPACEGIL